MLKRFSRWLFLRMHSAEVMELVRMQAFYNLEGGKEHKSLRQRNYWKGAMLGMSDTISILKLTEAKVEK